MRPLHNTLSLWLIGTALALAIAASIHIAPDADHPDADYPDAIAAAQDQRQEQRRQAAAQAICLQAHGGGWQAIWTQDGHLSCALKKHHTKLAASANYAQAAIN
jgi:hypothetical protein